MALHLHNIDDAKEELAAVDTKTFRSDGDSYKYFVTELSVTSFRHIKNLTIPFDHPVTVIAGTNTTGKTSLLLLLACSHEQFRKVDSTSPSASLRLHNWNDMLAFTSHENVSNNYAYSLKWRIGHKNCEGNAKRPAKSQAWTGSPT
jgi:recombinational DNA repair ATPase RecF